MLFFVPRDVLDEIWDLTESVSEGFPTYSSMRKGPTYFAVRYAFITFETEIVLFQVCLAHELRKLTRDTKCDISCLQTPLMRRNKTPNDERSRPP